ncbi:MAG: tetratricopeptide repeat protein [Phycisphaerales bacterium]|nr:tetratricopeptide repeat protein [Phycisphaerales bacterium]
MASRVNTKFVVILAGSLLGVTALVAGSVYVVMNKGPEDYIRMSHTEIEEGQTLLARSVELRERGQDAEAARVMEEARERFDRGASLAGRAVHRERQNTEYLEHWLEALSQVYPTSDADYQRKYGEYRSGLRELAVARRGDPEAQERYLRFRLDEMHASGSSDGWDFLANEADERLRQFAESTGSEPPAGLRRYRGIASAQRLLRNFDQTGRYDARVWDAALADLLASVGADPGDSDAARALVRLHRVKIAAARRSGDREQLRTHGSQALETAASLREADPDSGEAILSDLETRLFPDVRDAAGLPSLAGLRQPESEQGVAVQRELDEMGEDLQAAKAHLLRERVTDPRTLSLFLGMERLLPVERGLPMTKEIVDRALERNPRDYRMLQLRARVQETSGELPEAIATLQRIIEMPTLPVSLEGRLLIDSRNGAIAAQSSMLYLKWEAAEAVEDTARQDDLRGRLRRRHESLSARLPSDSPILAISGARLAIADGNSTRAAELLRTAAETGAGDDPQSLWMRARLAREAQNYTLAASLLRRAAELDQTQPRYQVELARTLEADGRYVEALEIYTRLERIIVQSDFIRNRISALRAVLGEGTLEDPIAQAVIDARRLLLGDALSPGDPEAAAQRVEQAAAELGDDPALMMELVRIHASQDRRELAISAVDRALAVSPGDREMERLRRVLEADDLAAAIGQDEDLPPAERALRQALAVTQLRGDTDEARRLFERAFELDADNPQTINAMFGFAMRTSNRQLAERASTRAQELNLDGVRGETYTARVASMRGERDRALSILRRASESRPDDTFVLRLLAAEQHAAGEIDAARSTYRRAVDLRGNDADLIREYTTFLARTGRSRDALDLLRDREQLAAVSPALRELRIDLEADVGDIEVALESRRSVFRRSPGDRLNALKLAGLYMDSGLWADARRVLDRLIEDGATLEDTRLLARWYAEQGRVEDGAGVIRSYVEALFGEGRRDEAGTALATLGEYFLAYGSTQAGLNELGRAARFDQSPDRAVQKRLARAQRAVGDHASAIRTMRDIIDAEADDAAENTRRSMVDSMIRVGDLEGAKRELASFENQREPGVAVLRARAEEGAGNLGEARRVLDGSISVYPNRPDLYAERALLSIRQGEQQQNRRMIRDAIDDLDTAVRLSPGSWRFLFLRGRAKIAAGEDEAGLNDLMAAVRADPNQDQPVALAISRLIENPARRGEALSVATEVIDRRPTDTRLMVSIGDLFANAEDWSRATTIYQRAWERVKDPSTARPLVRAMLRARPARLAEARSILNEVTDSVASDSGLLLLRAEVFSGQNIEEAAVTDTVRAFDMLSGSTAGAERWLTETRRIFGDGTRFSRVLDRVAGRPGGRHWADYFRARLAEERSGGWEDASRAYRTIAGGEGPGVVRRMAYGSLFGVLYSREQYREAADALRPGAEAFPDDWRIANNLAFVLSEHLSDPEAALPHARRGAEGSGSDPNAMNTLGRVLFRLEYWDEADRAFAGAMERSGQMESGRSTIALHMAATKLRLGDGASAKLLLEATLELIERGDTLDPSDNALLERVRSEVDSLG